MSLLVRTQVSLKPYNSFAVAAQASHFAEAENDQQVREALAYAEVQQLPLLVLGGGSNLLLTTDVKALVLRMGGTLGVQSRPGEGSVFSVRLPVVPD